MRPTVQVGDPFTEKLLLEACLEVMKHRRGRRHPGHGRRRPDLLELRDGGARWYRHRDCTWSACPQREEGITPYELLLSESQERMLLVADAGREEEVLEVFRKWDLDA